MPRMMFWLLVSAVLWSMTPTLAQEVDIAQAITAWLDSGAVRVSFTAGGLKCSDCRAAIQAAEIDETQRQQALAVQDVLGELRSVLGPLREQLFADAVRYGITDRATLTAMHRHAVLSSLDALEPIASHLRGALQRRGFRVDGPTQEPMTYAAQCDTGPCDCGLCLPAVNPQTEAICSCEKGVFENHILLDCEPPRKDCNVTTYRPKRAVSAPMSPQPRIAH